MRRALAWTGAILAVAAAVHVAVLLALPYVLMGLVLHGQQARAGTHRFLHPPLPTDRARNVVRPSPDFAYSSALFEVRSRPLRVVVPLTAPFTSVSGFADDTDNFFAVNDRTAGGPELVIVIVGPHTPRTGLAGQRVVVSPSDRGILLVRRVVPDAASFPAIDAARRQARCDPFDLPR